MALFGLNLYLDSLNGPNAVEVRMITLVALL